MGIDLNTLNILANLASSANAATSIYMAHKRGGDFSGAVFDNMNFPQAAFSMGSLGNIDFGPSVFNMGGFGNNSLDCLAFGMGSLGNMNFGSTAFDMGSFGNMGLGSLAFEMGSFINMGLGSSAFDISRFGNINFAGATNNPFFNKIQQSMPKFERYNPNFNTRTNLTPLAGAYNPKLGRSLASIAHKNASIRNSKHKCLSGVRETLEDAGLIKGSMGISAYLAAGILERNKNFKEVSVSRNDLKKLPAGCVIVWDRTQSRNSMSDIHGHATITLGDGREASDHVSNKIYMLRSKHRVFVPVASTKLTF